MLRNFNKGLVNNKAIEYLKVDVEKFSASFDMPGFLVSNGLVEKKIDDDEFDCTTKSLSTGYVGHGGLMVHEEDDGVSETRLGSLMMDLSDGQGRRFLGGDGQGRRFLGGDGHGRRFLGIGWWFDFGELVFPHSQLVGEVIRCSWGSCRGGTFRGFVESQICHCGEVVVLRVAKTVKNEGKQFWGCPNYKRTRNEELKGCNFFKWCIEDNVDDAGSTITRQRRKINSLEKSVMSFQRREKMLISMLCFMGFINIILLCILFKSP
ncbi:hypothetical protein V8G54_001871 [Vigna mungo]|uniref:GRF-type domain-containing protein n=1 Tax=Vigna mungo TaxID=3915 RepID=A0AAQ3SAA4_VIGMU